MEKLCVSHWEKIKQYFPSLQSVLRFLGEAQFICARVGALIDSIMLFIGPKILVTQSLIQLFNGASNEELK